MQNKEIRIMALLALDTVFFLIEAVIGYTVHSLALIADSFHMLNDIISLIVALWAVRVKNTKPADGEYTYGWQRAEILGALINAVFLLALCFTIVIDAVQRLISPEVITNPELILIVGFAGLVSNGVGLVLFHEHGHSHSHGHGDEESHSHSHAPKANSASPFINDSNNSSDDIRELFPENVVSRINENTSLLAKTNTSDHGHSHSDEHDDHHDDPKKKKSMNMEGVFLHVLGDALGNIGVIITALFIWKTDYTWKYYSDPIVSLVITAIIFSSALPLCKNASKILLQATPASINADQILDSVCQIPGVISVHDFHIWNLNEDLLIASLHLDLSVSTDEFLIIVTKVREILHGFGINSATIQPEFKRGVTVNPELRRTASAYNSTGPLNCVVDDTVAYHAEEDHH